MENSFIPYLSRNKKANRPKTSTLRYVVVFNIILIVILLPLTALSASFTDSAGANFPSWRAIISGLTISGALFFALVAMITPKYGKKENNQEAQLSKYAGFEQLAETMPYFAWILDKESRYIWANSFFKKMIGLSQNELTGRSETDLWPGLTAEKLERNSILAREAGELYSTVEEVDFGTGIERSYQITHVPLTDESGKLLGFAVTARDVEKVKRARERLEKSEEKFSKLFYNSPNWLLVATVKEGRYIEVNNAFCQMTGYNRQDVIGKTSIEFGLWPNPEDRKEIRNMLEQNGRFDTLPCKFRMKDASLRDFLWSAVVIELDGEQCALSTLADVTELEQTRKEKEKLNEQLIHAQKMKAIGTLAGGLAHDLNNLLTGIKGRNSLMLVDKKISPQVRDYILEIDTYTESAASLTRQLLGFARGGKYEVKHIDINRLINNSAEMFGRAKKEITIELDLQKDCKTIFADLHQIEQVFLNLFINAWQAMGEVPGTLKVKTKTVHIDVNHSKATEIDPGEYVEIIVSDNGHGMDRETASRVFEPFFSTRTREKGTGLGLASVYGIINNHYGVIDVQSKVGSGTSFTILLPAHDNTADIEHESGPDMIHHGGGRILFVDDEKISLEIGKELLGRLGYDVVVASSGQEALDIFVEDSSEFVLVIFDMVMPEMNGDELFDKLKVINPRFKSILTSGYSVKGQAAKIMSKGCNGFIQKPYGLKELSVKISEILDY